MAATTYQIELIGSEQQTVCGREITVTVLPEDLHIFQLPQGTPRDEFDSFVERVRTTRPDLQGRGFALAGDVKLVRLTPIADASDEPPNDEPEPLKSSLTVQSIAHLCHDANRALCRVLNDHSQLVWEDAPDWQRRVEG